METYKRYKFNPAEDTPPIFICFDGKQMKILQYEEATHIPVRIVNVESLNDEDMFLTKKENFDVDKHTIQNANIEVMRNIPIFNHRLALPNEYDEKLNFTLVNILAASIRMGYFSKFQIMKKLTKLEEAFILEMYERDIVKCQDAERHIKNETISFKMAELLTDFFQLWE